MGAEREKKEREQEFIDLVGNYTGVTIEQMKARIKKLRSGRWGEFADDEEIEEYVEAIEHEINRRPPPELPKALLDASEDEAPAPQEEKEERDEKAPDPDDHYKLLSLVEDFEEKSVDEIKAIIEELQSGRYDNFGFPGEVNYHMEELLEEKHSLRKECAP